MVNVGLVTGPSTPSARQAPRTKVVLPLPSSPCTSTTSPGSSRRPSSAPRASVASALSGSALMAPKSDLLEEVHLRRRGRHRLAAAGGRRGSAGRMRGRLLEQRGQAGEVLPERRESGGCAQRGGRVAEGVQPHPQAAKLMNLRAAADAHDAAIAPGEELGGEVAEGADHPGLDQLDLLEEVGLARRDLVRLGIAVAGRTVLEHVRD